MSPVSDIATVSYSVTRASMQRHNSFGNSRMEAKTCELAGVPVCSPFAVACAVCLSLGKRNAGRCVVVALRNVCAGGRGGGDVDSSSWNTVAWTTDEQRRDGS